MLDVTKLSEVGIDDVASLPPDTILAVDSNESWSVVVKRALRSGQNGWSYVERVDPFSVIRSMLADGAKLRVYDPQLAEHEFEWAGFNRVYMVGDEPEALGRVAAWTDDETGPSAAILVSVNPRQYRGSGCSYTSDDTAASLLRALDCRPGAQIDPVKVSIYQVPLGWG